MIDNNFVIPTSQLLFAGLCAWIASGKNRSAVGWAVLGGIFSIVALIVLVCLDDAPIEADTKAGGLIKENLRLKLALSDAERAAARANPLDYAASLWHVGRNGSPRGPMTFDELRRYWRARRIGRDDYVWTPGMPQWREIRRLAGMADSLEA